MKAIGTLLVLPLCLAAAPAPELPERTTIHVSLMDFGGETVIGSVRMDELQTAATMPRGELRRKLAFSITGMAASPLLNRPDIAALTARILLPGDDFDAARAVMESGGIVCNCSELVCGDPTVCGISCKGPCVDCLICRAIDGPGAPVKGRPRK